MSRIERYPTYSGRAFMEIMPGSFADHRGPDPCVMRPDQPHVCRRPDHEQRHGRPTPKEKA